MPSLPPPWTLRPTLALSTLIGLWLSLAGDVALLWPNEGFLPGLVSFLLAHLACLVAFTRPQRFAAWWPAFAAYAVVAGLILWRLWPGIPGALQLPVLAYVLSLASMAAQAGVLWRRDEPRAESRPWVPPKAFARAVHNREPPSSPRRPGAALDHECTNFARAVSGRAL